MKMVSEYVGWVFKLKIYWVAKILVNKIKHFKNDI